MAIKETSRLPEEIVESILLKLPVKSLVRFKTVSKSWNTMISNPRFIHTNIEECKNSRSHDLFLSILLYHPDTSSWVPKSGEFSFVKFENRKLETVKVVKNPCGGWRVYDVTICDGVVLLIGSRTEFFMLWNPSTRTHRVFELPYDGNGERFIPKNRGFCHDKLAGFKFVVVCRRDCYLVYTCKNAAWKVKQHEKLVEGPMKLWGFQGVSVDDGIYWINRHKTCHGGLVYFDPSDDKLKLLPKPENIDIGRYDDVFLVDLKGRLCLFRTAKDKSTVRFWIKDKGLGNNVWKHLVTIENKSKRNYFFKPVCFVEGFKILIQKRGTGEYVLYNLCENKFEDVECEDGLLRKQVVPYWGSLLFPTEEKI